MRGTKEEETEKIGRRKNRRQDWGRGKEEEDDRKNAEDEEGESCDDRDMSEGGR